MMADGFVQNGAKVYIVSRKLDACKVTADELTAKGPGQCIALQADLMTEAACKQLAEEIAKRESRVDVLVHNAGMGVVGGIETTPEEDFVDQDLASELDCAVPSHSLPVAAAGSPGAARIINVGSIGGSMPQRFDVIAYDTSKGALHHLTRVLAAKLARRPNGGHILVNPIAPGSVPTEMTEPIVQAFGKPFTELERGLPMQRVGRDSDMAGIAIFLASKASGWITGTVTACDGGSVGAIETGVSP